MALHVCVRGIGIRRSKDLRAEIGKCPNSTNERKNMSTKTIYKRIALVAVAALGAGVLSVVPANAAATTATAVFGDNGANGALADATTSLSAGVLGTKPASTSITASGTILSTGALGLTVGASLAADGTTVQNAVVTVSGATISSSASADATSADQRTVGANNAFGVVIVPNSGVASFTVQVYDNTTANSSSAGGTLVAQAVVTVAATSVAGAYSASKSLVNTAVVGNNTNAGIDIANATTGSASMIPNNAKAQINFTLKDAYGTGLPSGPMAATATNGALVGFNATLGTTATPANTADVISDSSGSLTVVQATANVAMSTTVTITYKGITVGTKTFNFQGEVATVTASAPRVAYVGSAKTVDYTDAVKATNAAFVVRYFDGANNELWPSDGTSATTLVSGLTNASVTAASVAANGDGTAAKPVALGAVTCAIAGSASLQLQYVNASGTVVKSNTWTQACGGDANSYTASFDKAVYTPGSIATLTITFKDSKGNLTNNGADNIAATGKLIAITGGPAATAVNIPAATDRAGTGTNAAGTITYQFVVGTTEGSFSAIVDAPQVANGTKQTVAYSIATGTVSNADVLKAIVSLIASINKQIAALQKALLRR
jgi:hypothetical protein